MRFISNTGRDRVFDNIQAALGSTGAAHIVTPSLSLFAWEAMRSSLADGASVKQVVPAEIDAATLLGSEADRQARNRLNTPYLAKTFSEQLRDRVQMRGARGAIPQGLIVGFEREGNPKAGWGGALAMTTDGLGLTPGNPLSC